ncbi:hypothetical protein [Arundinibacter roseus]|uniref:DUF3575 domain-containing protein n=1 Tax=Arundinibacter roseus TaxID=2070510 RepID=A0A4R4JVU7_9BACT|nr:hypothetical protein [Arundinibacter roseus]TDB58222.1 hypothetical protein EZE20_23165 [Arundinibacter roseus]
MQSTFLSAFVLSVFLVGSVIGQTVTVDSLSENRAGSVSGKEHTFGIDVFKNIPYLFFANKVPLDERRMLLTNRGIVELTWRRQKRERSYQTALLGYSQVEVVSPKSVERRQNATGFYAKLGKEWSVGKGKAQSQLGLRAMMTYCRYSTELLYPGPTFGDYKSLDVVHNIGIGIDPYYALDFSLNQQWLLRWETRLAHHYRIAGKGYTPYYPGVGFSPGLYNYIISPGTTLQIHYRFHGRKAE